MKKTLLLLLAAALALTLTACGSKKVPDDELEELVEQQVRYDREGVEMTGMELVSNTVDADGMNNVVVNVTSETAYVTYEDQYTMLLEYNESSKQWYEGSSDGPQRTTLRAEPKNIPDAATLADIIAQNQQDGYGLLQVPDGEDEWDSKIMPFDYTVGEPVSEVSESGGVSLQVPLQVEGCRYGGLVFHGTREADLGMWPDTGEWQLHSVEPGEGFAVSSVLDGRTYTSVVYESIGPFQDYPREYTTTIQFGVFDWNTQTFPETTQTIDNLTERSEEKEEVECYLGNTGYGRMFGDTISLSAGTWSCAAELPPDDAESLPGYNGSYGDLEFTLQQ